MDCTTKTCRDCGLEKPLEDFHRNAGYPDRLQPYCKPCSNRRRRENYRVNAEPGYQPRRQRHRRDLGDEEAWCSRCQEAKPLTSFVMSNGHPHAYCNPCKAAYAREHLRRPGNREKVRRRTKATQFGLSLEEYDVLMERTSCAICGGSNGGRTLGIDHDHVSGRVRDRLCDRCNAGIAMFLHDPDRMRLAIAYLEKWSALTASAVAG